MGQARRRRVAFFENHPTCIFCGGTAPATTQEHCPPRAMFSGRQWPVGYEFASCAPCNNGSADEDLIVVYLAHLEPVGEGDEERMNDGKNLMLRIEKRHPGFLSEMLSRTAVQARADARRLNLTPAPGQTHQELGIVNIPAAMHKAVAVFASKLTKAIYFRRTGRIFPADGGIMFLWFTNAQRMEHGRIPAIEAMKTVVTLSEPLMRSGQDLKEQFDYAYSPDKDGELHALQVVFGTVFGFFSVLSQTPGRIEAIEERLRARFPDKESPFTFISTNRRPASDLTSGPVLHETSAPSDERA